MYNLPKTKIFNTTCQKIFNIVLIAFKFFLMTFQGTHHDDLDSLEKAELSGLDGILDGLAYVTHKISCEVSSFY